MMITSDLSRAIETAKIIGSKINLPINYFEKRVREINLGEIEGTTEEERVKKWGMNWREQDTGMERFGDVAKRGIEFIEEIVDLHKGKRVLVVIQEL